MTFCIRPRQTRLLYALLFPLLLLGCGQLTLPWKPVLDSDIQALSAQGFTLVSAQRIRDMQIMKRPEGICRAKRNVCGMAAGISATFMLDPQEAFYDVKRPPTYITFGDGKTEYDTLGKNYPIMRPVALPSLDLGVLPETLAAFWSRYLRHHTAVHRGFDSVLPLIDVAKAEISAGRPVLLQVTISAPGHPLYLPDRHLGPRGFNNAHWVVLVGYSAQEWVIRDNGGLYQTLSGSPSSLLRVSTDSLTKLADLSELSDDVKLYIDDPSLPVFLDDWENSDNDGQLRNDFRSMRAYNLVIFTKK